MASYLILDGYNVIGAIERYRTRVTGGLDESRELLVNDALKAAGWTGREIIIVFDAHRSPESEGVEERAGGAVRLIYSAPNESADDVIERLLANLDGPATVYTADFALQRTALQDCNRAGPALTSESLLTAEPAGRVLKCWQAGEASVRRAACGDAPG